MRTDELAGVVESFAAAAARAREAGFDGVQIHAAHGYLLSEFLTPHTNRRDDDYGGSLTNRARLLLEVLTAIRGRVGDDFPVLAKLNGTDMLPLRRAATTDELVAVGVALQDAGLDAIEISRAHYESWPGIVLGNYNGFWRAQIHEGLGQKVSLPRKAFVLAAAPLIEHVAQRLAPGSEGFNLPYAERFTRALDIPVICVGGFHSRAAIEGALRADREEHVVDRDAGRHRDRADARESRLACAARRGLWSGRGPVDGVDPDGEQRVDEGVLGDRGGLAGEGRP